MQNATHSALWGMRPHFLLVYRDQRGLSAIIMAAPSLAAARIKAANAGLNTPNSFRLGHELDAELIALVTPGQIGRILSAAEARELLARFEARRSTATQRPVADLTLRLATLSPTHGRLLSGTEAVKLVRRLAGRGSSEK
jgi:hypothetical protein